MKKIIRIFFIISLLIVSQISFAANTTLLLNLNGPIGPAAQDYIERGIERANLEKADVVILQMNTPGGLESSMRGINAAILKSTVPVISYVAPSGARAASAGIFIMYASHLSYMAPGTNAGAASPVHLTGSNEKDNKTLSTESKKAMNDASAYIRSLAQLRGRNAAWAELAVTKAASVSAEEAKKMNIISGIASDTAQLLKTINGKIVSVNGKPATIQTEKTQIKTIETDWRYDFLSFITNPNIAYLLILLAMYGLFFELSNPGLILPGVAGLIALLLALYAFQLLPVNYAGLSLIFIGLVFMVMEVYVTSYGALGIGGVIAFILGSIMLFDTADVHFRLDWQLITAMSVISLSFFFIIATMVIRAHKRAIVTGQEGLIGAQGTVISVMNEQIVVSVMGELWEASTNKPLQIGDKIKVTAVQGLHLRVEQHHEKIKRR